MEKNKRRVKEMCLFRKNPAESVENVKNICCLRGCWFCVKDRIFPLVESEEQVICPGECNVECICFVKMNLSCIGASGPFGLRVQSYLQEYRIPRGLLPPPLNLGIA